MEYWDECIAQITRPMRDCGEGSMSQQVRVLYLNDKRAPWSFQERETKKLSLIYQSIDDAIFERITNASTYKEAWGWLLTPYKRAEKVKKAHI